MFPTDIKRHLPLISACREEALKHGREQSEAPTQSSCKVLNFFQDHQRASDSVLLNTHSLKTERNRPNFTLWRLFKSEVGSQTDESLKKLLSIRKKQLYELLVDIRQKGITEGE